MGMKEMEAKIEEMLSELKQIDEQVMEPGLAKDQKRYAQLMRQYQQGLEIKANWERYQSLKRQIDDLRRSLSEESERELLLLYEEELLSLEAQLEGVTQQLKLRSGARRPTGFAQHYHGDSRWYRRRRSRPVRFGFIPNVSALCREAGLVGGIA